MLYACTKYTMHHDGCMSIVLTIPASVIEVSFSGNGYPRNDIA